LSTPGPVKPLQPWFLARFLVQNWSRIGPKLDPKRVKSVPKHDRGGGFWRFGPNLGFRDLPDLVKFTVSTLRNCDFGPFLVIFGILRHFGQNWPKPGARGASDFLSPAEWVFQPAFGRISRFGLKCQIWPYRPEIRIFTKSLICLFEMCH